MKRNRKSFGFACVFSLITMAEGVCADTRNQEGAQLRNLENRVTALEQRKGMSSLINPPAGPHVRNGIDLAIRADLFVWKAQENGLPIAQIVTGSDYVGTGSTTFTTINSSLTELQHRWDLGFRLGVDYDLPHDGWDVSLTWLRFNTRAQADTGYANNTTKFITPALSSADFLVENPTQATARYKLALNQLDLVLGRDFFVSKWLSLRPNMGLRTDWITQRLHLLYVANSPVASPPSGFHSQSDQTYDRLKYWGVGPTLGLDTEWGLGSGLSLYGNGSVAILYGFFKNNTYCTNILNDDAVPSQDFTHGYFFDRVSRPIIDLQIGLRWGRSFCEDQFHLQISGGWEQHIYFGMNEFPLSGGGDFTPPFSWNQGDLTTQGWTLSAQVNF